MIAALFLALFTAAPSNSAVDRRPPIDECASDPSFVSFRDALRNAVERKDRDFILATISDEIDFSFGGDSGRAEFVRSWRLEQGESSPLWAELDQVLRLGCARGDGDLFWAPSLVEQLDDQEDPFTAVIAVRPGAVLRAAPDAGSEAVAALEWDVLTLHSDDGADAWLPVRLTDGRHGYVRREDVRSAIDSRAAFQKIDGRWRMVVFIAGD